MRRTTFTTAVVSALGALAASHVALHAQSTRAVDHPSHTAHAATSAASTGREAAAPAGQDAYAAIAAIVAQLEADSSTDWSTVNIEALRRHLIAMNDVTLGATVVQVSIPAGARMDVTGEGRAAESIRAMLGAHAPELEALGQYRASVQNIAGGARLTVTASDSSDTLTVAKIRSLGFMGLLTLGNHHAAHHVALARGQSMPGHPHE